MAHAEDAQHKLCETTEKLQATTIELDRLLARHKAIRDRQATMKLMAWLARSKTGSMSAAVQSMQQNKEGDVTLERHTRAMDLMREAIGYALPAWNAERQQRGLDLLRTSLVDKVHEINRRAREARAKRGGGMGHVTKHGGGW